MIEGVTSAMQTNQVPELELLPPRPRYVCEDCGKGYKKVEQCKDGKRRCRNCKRKMVTNIFYIPPTNDLRKMCVGKYSISDTEKQILGPSRAKKVSMWLYKTKKEKQQNLSNEQNKVLEKEKQLEQKRKFLEGLGLK